MEAAKESPYYALFCLALYTGMRRSELLALRWHDVDFLMCNIYINRSLHHLKNGTYVFTEPKTTKSRRSISLSPSAILILGEHKRNQEVLTEMIGGKLADDGLVFATLEGDPLRPNTITRAWTTLATHAGLKVIRLHDARHTHASLMLKQGIHPKIVQERLGHSSISMTLDTYSHVAPGLQQKAAESFDRLLNPEREKEAIESHY